MLRRTENALKKCWPRPDQEDDVMAVVVAVVVVAVVVVVVVRVAMIAVIEIAMAAVMMVMVGVMMGILVGMNDNRTWLAWEAGACWEGRSNSLIIIRMPEFRGRNAARRSFDVRLYASMELLLLI
jgi:hypothetical protein